MNHIGQEGINPCCGCAACAIHCPANAIKMRVDRQGFYTPRVDESVCTQCGLCRDVCFQYESFPQRRTDLYEQADALAVITNLIEQSRQVTTVGVATRLAEHFGEKGHAVCGVVYDYKTHCAKHVVADSRKDRLAMRGSKYLQSHTLSGFTEVLDQSGPAIVFGTPCQIYGFRKILEQRNIEDRFLLVDLFCAGVPSQHLWTMYRSYLQRCHGVGELVDVNYRDKTEGWLKYSLHATDHEGNTYRDNVFNDLFYACYLRKTCNAASCYACPFRHRAASCDIRLGDFWGPNYQRFTDGVELMTLHTERGRTAWREISDICVTADHSAEDVYNSQRLDKCSIPDCRDDVLDSLARKVPLEELFAQLGLGSYRLGGTSV